MKVSVSGLVVVISAAMLLSTSSALARDIILSPGDSLEKARDEAKSGDRIILHGGRYQLDKTLALGPENSGLTWMAAPGETPVFSGGVIVLGWTADWDGVWKAKLERNEKLRQLYVNGNPARMARLKKSPQGGIPYGEFVVQGNEPWAFIKGKGADGISYGMSAIPDVANPSDLEVRDTHNWMNNRVCVRGLKEEAGRKILLFEQPMGAIAQTQLWATGFAFRGLMDVFNAREFLTEPGEFYFDRTAGILYYMPRPGEDLTKSQVIAPVLETLVSIRGKNLMQRASGIRFEGVTFAETGWQLMQVGDSHGACGTQSCALTVKYSDGNWHGCMYQSTDLPRAMVEVNSAAHIKFSGDSFCLAGAIGLNLENDVTESTVLGNVFSDIGSCAINVGHPQHVYIGKQNGDNEGYGPYNIDNHRDKWDETVEGLCTNVRVADNLIRHTGIEHQPSPALSVFYGHGITVEHNDLKYAPYSGISFGWGWENWDVGAFGRSKENPQGKPSLSLEGNTVRFNKIGHVLQVLADGGGIYILARQEPIAKIESDQKWLEVNGNYIYEFGGWARNGIHPDNGCRFVYFHDNVFKDIAPDNRNHRPAALIKVNQFANKGNFKVENNFANVPMSFVEAGYTNIAPNTTFKDNIEVPDNQWPDRARQIIENSGLEPAYRNLLDRLPKEPEGEIDKTRWKVLSNSAEGGPGGLAARAIDGDPGTLWHTLTPTGPKPPPQEIVVDMGEPHTLSGFLYLPRQDGNTTGNVSRYAMYVSGDGKTWGEPTAQGEFSDIKTNPIQRRITFARPATGRYFKFVALASADGNLIAVAELGVIGR